VQKSEAAKVPEAAPKPPPTAEIPRDTPIARSITPPPADLFAAAANAEELASAVIAGVESPTIPNNYSKLRKRPGAKALVKHPRPTRGGLTPREASSRTGPKMVTTPRRVVKKAKTTMTSPVPISVGKPDEDLPGGWPAGWVKKVYERKGGKFKGKGDPYWYSPKENIKLRSMVEVRKFMKALKESKGDEPKAKSIYKSIQL
jgi:hypothetical protein